MTEEYGQELMGAVLKPPKASVYQLAVQFENGEYSLLELDGYYAKAFIDASAKEKAALFEPAHSREKKISCMKKSCRRLYFVSFPCRTAVIAVNDRLK